MTLLTLRHLHGSRQLAMFASLLKKSIAAVPGTGGALMGYGFCRAGSAERSPGIAIDPQQRVARAFFIS